MKHRNTCFRNALQSAGILFFIAFFSVNSSAQSNAVTGNNSVYGDSLDGFNVAYAYQKAAAKGLDHNETQLFVTRCEKQFIAHKYNIPQQKNTSLAAMRIPATVAQAPCTNMDFETGNFTGWTGFIGDNTVNSNGPLQNITNGFFSTTMDAAISDMNARHTIMSIAGGTDPYGGFPVVAPGGQYSCRLGNNYANYQGEAIEQTFTVAAGNTSFTYQYAAVLNDGGHSSGEQPYFRIEMFDQSGNLIPCSQYYVEAAGGNTPGFTVSPIDSYTYYKPWTTVNVDLTNYMASSVTIRFTAAGCIWGGHFGYAYVDASCLPYSISLSDSLCQGGNITLTAPAGAASYQWSTGSTSQSINVNTAGSYSVTMTSVTGCQTTLTRNVAMYPPPTASFTAAAPSCASNFSFTNNSSISSGTLSYSWDFGDPSTTSDTSNVQSPNYTYTNTGTYTVTLTVTSNNGCTDTYTQTVTAGSGSNAAFSATSVCVGTATQFTDQSVNAVSWDWDFGDPGSGPNNTSSLQNPSHTFSAPGTYNVTLTAGTSPCNSVITQTVTVNPIPTASFVYNQVCGQQLVNFTSTSTVANPSTITSTSWNFGDPASGGNNTSTLTNPSHTFTAQGTYTVTLTVTTGSGCPQTTTMVISVGVPPTSAFVASTVCTNSPMQFTNQSVNAGSYSWNFGDPSTIADTSNATNPAYTYTNPGTYTVTLIANPGPCSDTSSLVVNVAPGPVVQFTAPPVCEANPTSFTDQSNISSGSITGWSWDFGVAASSSDTSNVQNPNFTYPASGTYTVSLTCTSNNGCVTTNTMAVTVNGLPTANFSSNVVCAGQPTSFTDLSNGNPGSVTQWTWNFGDGSPTASSQNPTHTYTNDTTYNVTLIVSNAGGCSDTVTLQAVTASMPNVQFMADTLHGCPVLCVNFTDQTTIASGSLTGWVWDFGDNSGQDFTQNPSHCYATPGTYTVTLTASSGNGCASTLVIPDMITVYPVPVADFSANPQHTTVLNADINFFDLSQGANYWQWDFGDPTTTSDTSSMQDPFYAYTTEYGSNYDVHLQVANQYGCMDDTTIEVIIDPEFTFYIPNAFTPNGDGINDVFYGTGIGITSYTMYVFDRWGNLIFTANDINQSWDGTVQGKSGQLCQEDVYVWKVVLTDVFDKKHKYIGHVSLIR
ncbi:MAG TPA: PKD domain-containing protein [Bacteroidia bacterium]|nr:PKD domain-containing protein [Bacteroidia bacterium]